MFGVSQFKSVASQTFSTNSPSTTPRFPVAVAKVVTLALRRLQLSVVMAGAKFSIVILSSSPPAPELYSPQDAPPSGQRVAMRAYSPFSPSPLVSPNGGLSGALLSDSRATIVCPEPVRGFATVGSLVRSEHITQQLDEEVGGIQQEQSNRTMLEDVGGVLPAKKPKKQVAKASAAAEVEEPKPKPRVRKPKADRYSTEITGDPELRAAPTNSSRSTINVAVETVETAPKLTKAGKPRKPRAKKEKVDIDAEPESKPKRTRGTKPKATKAVTKAAGKTHREDVCIVSAHFRNEVDHDDTTREHAADNHNSGIGNASIRNVPPSPRPKKQALSKEPQDSLTEGLALEEAVVRRRNWTPPRDTAMVELQTPFTDSTEKENRPLAVDENATFGNMLTSFAYVQSPSAQSMITMTNSTVESSGPTKRRRVDLIGVPNNRTNSRNSSPDKGKAPKKKPRTITDIATEQYVSKDSMSDLDIMTSDFFQSRTITTTKKVPLNDASDPNDDALLKQPPRRRATSKTAIEKAEPKTKAKRTTTKSKAKTKPVVETLLSPASAVLRMNSQDILFGTSSQLAIEESPTTVRQIQMAIKESERDVDSFSDILSLAPPRWPKLGKVMGKNNLWDASARDKEGGLLEQMEDVYISEPDRTQDIPLLMDGIHDGPDIAHELINVDDLEPPPDIIISSDPPTPPLLSQPTSQAKVLSVERIPTDTSTFKDIDDFEQPPPPSNQNAESQNSFADIDDFDFPPSTQLHFSPVWKAQVPELVTSNCSPTKRRGKRPKSQSAYTSALKPTKPTKPTLPNVHAKAKEPSSIPSTTPPKSTGRFVDIEEILDSEDETLEMLSPTPPRIRSSPDIPPNVSARPPFPTSTSLVSATAAVTAHSTTADGVTRVYRIPSQYLEYNHIKSHLFAQITAHIRAMTPTSDPKKPNWHEKILMYDPIVLEDFTAYLNTYTSIHLYKRATQKQIKAWNKFEKEEAAAGMGEGAKIKLGMSGGDSVFSMEGDLKDVLVVEKELEATMVRDWCESLSVCAIWSKEGRKKGTARKGLY